MLVESPVVGGFTAFYICCGALNHLSSIDGLLYYLSGYSVQENGVEENFHDNAFAQTTS